MAITFNLEPHNPGAIGSLERAWTLVYAKLDGTNLADISGADERKMTWLLNKPSTCEFTLNLLHPAVEHIFAEPHGLIKAYKDRKLVGVWETLSVQGAGEGEQRTLKIVGSEPGFIRLQRRYIGQTLNGFYSASADRAAVAADLIYTENLRYSTGIAIGNIQPTSLAQVGPWWTKQALEAIDELATPLNGFDYWFEPADPKLASGIVARFNAAPVRGVSRPLAHWQYGTGRVNLRSYEVIVDSTHRISRAISLPSSYPDNLTLDLIYQDDITIWSEIGIREDVVENDLIETGLREALVREHVAIRKNPRIIYRFQPHIDDRTGRVPRYPFDYNVGDIVRGSVNDQNVLILDGWVRVFGVEVTLDKEGREDVTLTLVDET
jgi:hypothetical protein